LKTYEPSTATRSFERGEALESLGTGVVERHRFRSRLQ
jgi:hypothetical protein